MAVRSGGSAHDMNWWRGALSAQGSMKRRAEHRDLSRPPPRWPSFAGFRRVQGVRTLNSSQSKGVVVVAGKRIVIAKPAAS